MKSNWIYNLMQKYANKHDNLGDYTQLHAGTWFFGYILLAIAMLSAAHCDFSVIYSMYFNVSRNETASLILAIGGATVIQALIFLSGMMCLKLWINGKSFWMLGKRIKRVKANEKLSDAQKVKQIQMMRHNARQYGVHTPLLLIGLTFTGFLSWHSNQRTQAEAFFTKQTISQNNEQQIKDIQTERFEQSAAVWSKLHTDSTAVEKQYTSLINHADPLNQASMASYHKRYEAGLISEKKYLESTTYLNTQIKPKVAPLMKQKADKIMQLRENADLKVAKIDSIADAKIAAVQSEKSVEVAGLSDNLGVASTSIKGLNLGLNIIALLLNLGLLLFAKGANVDKKEPTEYLAAVESGREFVREKDLIVDIQFEAVDAVNHSKKRPQSPKKATQPSSTKKESSTNTKTQNLVEHNGKWYTEAQCRAYAKKYQERASKYLKEGKIGLVKPNREKFQMWMNLAKQAADERK